MITKPITVAEALTRMQATLDRMRERSEDPEFQARVQASDAEERARLAEQAKSDRLRYLLASGIGRTYWPMLDGPRETDAIIAVRKALEPSGPKLVILAGPQGRGKTAALSWLAYERRGYYVTTADLSRISGFAESDWRDLATAPTLALDECGAEFLSDFAASNICATLIERVENDRPTALATNLNAADFATRFLRGSLERLRDRFRTIGHWQALPGPSMRQPPPKPWSDTDKENNE